MANSIAVNCAKYWQQIIKTGGTTRNRTLLGFYKHRGTGHVLSVLTMLPSTCHWWLVPLVNSIALRRIQLASFCF